MQGNESFKNWVSKSVSGIQKMTQIVVHFSIFCICYHFAILRFFQFRSHLLYVIYTLIFTFSMAFKKKKSIPQKKQNKTKKKIQFEEFLHFSNVLPTGAAPETIYTLQFFAISSNKKTFPNFFFCLFSFSKNSMRLKTLTNFLKIIFRKILIFTFI